MKKRHEKILIAIVILLFLGILISLLVHAMMHARAVKTKTETHPYDDKFPKDHSYDFPKDWSSVWPKAMLLASVIPHALIS